VLFHLGSFAVTGYAALVNVGLIGGVVIACLAARRRGLEPIQALDASLAAALGGLIGGRAVYVAAHWAYYGDHLRRALRPWDGGLAWHGALVGGMIALSAYCAIRRTPLRLMLDVLTPGVPLLAICAWLGCLLNGCAYGLETYPGQGLALSEDEGLLWALSLELPDLYGIWVPRVAVQLLGAGWSAITLAVILVARRRTRFEGLVFPIWLTLYSVGSLGLGFLRADETLPIVSWRADQVADLALALIGATALAASLFGMKRTKRA
jgi:phosphatidylglycerol:prolipoprotein diacylglycerol transferase